MSANRPTPRKWELWAAIFLLVIWSSNAAAGNLERADSTEAVVNDLMLVGGIIWLISVLVRLSAYKRSQGDQ